MKKLVKDDAGSVGIWVLVFIGILGLAIIWGVFDIFMSDFYTHVNDTINHSSQFGQVAAAPTMTKILDVWQYFPVVVLFALILFGFIASAVLERM